MVFQSYKSIYVGRNILDCWWHLSVGDPRSEISALNLSFFTITDSIALSLNRAVDSEVKDRLALTLKPVSDAPFCWAGTGVNSSSRCLLMDVTFGISFKCYIWHIGAVTIALLWWVDVTCITVVGCNIQIIEKTSRCSWYQEQLSIHRTEIVIGSTSTIFVLPFAWNKEQGRCQTLNLGWAREEHFLILLLFSHIFPHFGPPTGRPAHPEKALAMSLTKKLFYCFGIRKIWYFTYCITKIWIKALDCYLYLQWVELNYI